MEREMQDSQRIHASSLEEVKLADNNTEPRKVLIAKEMYSTDKTRLVELLQQYKDMFVWSFEGTRFSLLSTLD